MAKPLSIGELAAKVNGKIVGDTGAEQSIVGTCAIDSYVKNKVTFVKNLKYAQVLGQLPPGAVVLIPASMTEVCSRYPKNIYVVSSNVLEAMMDLQDYFYGYMATFAEAGISPSAHIEANTRLGKGVYIGANAYVGRNVTIGERTKIFPNVHLCDDVSIGSDTYLAPGVYVHNRCQIGDECIIRAGTAIGVDGFRFEQYIPQKRVHKWFHAGNVLIGDRVDIGANAAIARATFEDTATVIGDDVKIDNLVHIAHNVRIGARTIIVTLTCIGGSCVIGEDAWIGIGASISNGVHIGNRAKILLNAVVAHDVPDDEMVSGFYAVPHRQWKRICQRLKKESE